MIHTKYSMMPCRGVARFRDPRCPESHFLIVHSRSGLVGPEARIGRGRYFRCCCRCCLAMPVRLGLSIQIHVDYGSREVRFSERRDMRGGGLRPGINSRGGGGAPEREACACLFLLSAGMEGGRGAAGLHCSGGGWVTYLRKVT